LWTPLPRDACLSYNKETMWASGKERRKRSPSSGTIALVSLSILIIAGCRPGEKRAAGQGGLEGDISISSAFALYPLILKLADEFHEANPGVQFDISAVGAAKSVSDTLNGLVDLGGISREVYPLEKDKGLWSVTVARDAVLAIASEDNPCLGPLLQRGISEAALARIWIGGEIRTWGELIGESSYPQTIHVYTRADSCGAGEIWAQFLGGQQEDLKGIGVHGESWMAGAIRRDPLGIGYTNLNFAYDARTLAPVPGIRVVPIDLDGNGRIDFDEDFYSSRTRVLEAIASDNYPSPPSRSLSLISRGIPRQRCVREFIVWTLTDGQAYIPASGYIPLPAETLEDSLRNLADR
jgi:phosphate transport system substrate-binding protein